MTDPLARLAQRPAVAAALAGERDAVDRLLADRWLRRHAADLSVAAGEQAARAGAALEGCPLAPALTLQAEAADLARTWEHAPGQALARMHLLALDAPGPEAGRPRQDPEVAHRLAQLLAAVDVTGAPAVVVSGIVHAELLAIRAFGERDGLIARAAARAVLVSSGHDPRAILPFEVGYAPASYGDLLAAYAAGDVTGWLVGWCAALVSAAEASLVLCAEQRAAAG